MIFADFVNTLKGHFKKSISNEKLCGILFDAIIAPADVKNSSGEVLTIEKGEISRIMNQKISMPIALQDHVYDNAVIAGLSGYFKTHIVSELAPQKSDLCYQLMTLIEADQNISPDSKVRFRLTANEDCIATFLAEVFIYVIRQDNKKRPTAGAAEHQPTLKLCGITESGELSSDVEVDRFHPRLEYNLVEYKDRIRQLYDDIARFSQEKSPKIDFPSIELPSFAKAMNALSSRQTGDLISIDDQSRAKIERFAEELNIVIPDDFCDIGKVYRHKPALSFNPPTFYGDDIGQMKYSRINTLLGYIDSHDKLVFVERFFENLLCVRLALKNDGSDFDEDINVRLTLPKDAWLTDDYLRCFDTCRFQKIIDDFSDVFYIKRSKNYFDYVLSDLMSETLFQRRRLNSLPGNDRNLVEEWNELFPYFTSCAGDSITIELEFGKIMQHTATAFPTVFLLRKYIPTIGYEIRSKSMPEVFNGSLTLQKK